MSTVLIALVATALAGPPPTDAELAAWFATDLEVATMALKPDDEKRALEDRVATRTATYEDLVRRLQASATGAADAAGLHHQVLVAKVHEDQAYTLMHAPAPTYLDGDEVPAWERSWLDKAAAPCAAARAAWAEAGRIGGLLSGTNPADAYSTATDSADIAEARYGNERLQITDADRRRPDVAGPLFVQEEVLSAGPLDDLPPHLLACRRARDW